MAKKGIMAKAKKELRDADDIIYLFTGKRIKNLAVRGLDLFGEEIRRKMRNIFFAPEPEVPPDSPYAILGVHPEALDIVVKAAYRSLAREYHPDTGQHSDVAKFQRATEAFNAIMEARKKAKEGTN